MLAIEKLPPLPTASGNWYCLTVRPNWIAKVEGELYALGYRTFTPKARRWISHARKRTAALRPILSRYLFVDVDYPNQAFAPVRSVRGVESLLSVAGRPISFTCAQVVDFLARQMKGEWDEVEKGKVPVGAIVAIVEGEDAGETAIVTKVKDRKVSYKVMDSPKRATVYASSVRAA